MHGVSIEEGNDRVDQIPPPSHHIAGQVLAVVVVAPIGDHASHPEELHEVVQARGALHALRHGELVAHLVAGSVALPAWPTWLPDKADGEATLSVYKTYNPAELDQSFLLISCTRHIVTVSPTWDGTRSARYTGVPAYGQMLTAWLPMRRAAIYLRTVPTVTTSCQLCVRHEAGRSFLPASHGRP
jgi:hypothetical protein